MFELVDSAPQSAVIKVVGVGGGGGNAVQHMVTRSVDGVDFVAANTDAQALKSLDAQTTLQIGSTITKGLARARIRMLAGPRHLRTRIALPRCCQAQIWCLSLPVWVGAQWYWCRANRGGDRPRVGHSHRCGSD